MGIFRNTVHAKLSRVVFHDQVILCDDTGRPAWRVWKLIPVRVEGTDPASQSSCDTPPSYDGRATGSEPPPTRVQNIGTERDEFGTIVNEVTTVTTTSTVTTRKRYRVEDA